MKIKILIPVNRDIINKQTLDAVMQLNLPDVVFDVSHLQRGPSFIARRYDERLAIEPLVEEAELAQQQGFDGIYVSSFSDTAVKMMKEAVNIPVVGAFHPSLITANLVSQTCAIVTVADSVKPMLIELAREYGLWQNLLGTYVIDIDLSQLKDPEVLLPALIKSSQEAVADGAQAIILGCGGMVGMATKLALALGVDGINIPVVDPTLSAVMQLYGLIKQSLVQSSIAYYRK